MFLNNTLTLMILCHIFHELIWQQSVTQFISHLTLLKLYHIDKLHDLVPFESFVDSLVGIYQLYGYMLGFRQFSNQMFLYQ